MSVAIRIREEAAGGRESESLLEEAIQIQPRDPVAESSATASNAQQQPAPIVQPTLDICGVPLRYIALAALVCQATAAVILTRQSKTLRPPGTPDYISTTLVIMQEATKLVFSLFFIFMLDLHVHESPAVRWGHFLTTIKTELFSVDGVKVAVPALLYTIQNNLLYVALANLEPTTYQVGYQMKVITTAVLSVAILGRKLCWQAWGSLVVLTLGIIVTQVEGSKEGIDETQKPQNFALGLTAVVICGTCSALAGVYFEKILKGTKASLWVRNAQLAFFACICGIFTMLVNDGFLNFETFFQGYSPLIWTVIMVQAVGGMIVAVIVKYADNIVKGFAMALSIVLSGFLSNMIFGFRPTVSYVFGSILVIIATVVYLVVDVTPKPAAQQQKSSQ
jgi:UDP-sugar transporter A1/2/3